jgi:hypothetical protein
LLTEHIISKPESYIGIENAEINETMLDVIDIDRMDLVPLLFQTGYLTVKEARFAGRPPTFTVDIPNLEVKEAFTLHVLSALTDNSEVSTTLTKTDMINAFVNGDMDKVLSLLRGLFASIPYHLHIEREAYYHTVFYNTMNVLGLEIDAEVSVSRGRVDAVLEVEDKVYVIEFKYVKCPADAGVEEKMKLFVFVLDEGMEQIKSKGYHKKYDGSSKSVYLLAFAFLGRNEIDMRVEYQ